MKNVLKMRVFIKDNIYFCKFICLNDIIIFFDLDYVINFKIFQWIKNRKDNQNLWYVFWIRWVKIYENYEFD